MEPTETDHYIVQTPEVRGGNPIVAGTSIGVHDVIGLLQNGESVDTLLETCFPSLNRSQVHACLAYFQTHRGEIDPLIELQASPFRLNAHL